MLAITTQLIEEQNLCQSKSLLQPYKDTLQQQLGDKELLKCTINLYQHKDRDFMETEITIFNNAIVMGDQYIMLSSTHNEMKYYKMKPHDCYIVILRNNLAKEVFYTHSETLFQKLQNIIKKFSITSNFIQKFQVLEHYGQLMTAQSQNGELFSVMQIDKADKEAFHNQITLWNYIQIQPNIIKICDDPKNYYLICQHLKLQSISNLLMQGFEMKEVQLVSIMFILLQTLQKYHNKGLYHGNLKIETVFLNIQSATLQINSLFPQYKKQSQKSIQDDLFDLGVILFQISFFKDNHFQELDDGIIRECRQNLQNFSQNGQKFKFLYRISQIDLMLLLLNRTCTLEQAQRHHWFITIKQNLKQENQGRHIMHKTNLQTIVEQCESLSSSQMVDPLKRFISISVEQEPEDEKPLKGLVYDGIMAPSKAKHDHYARIGAFQQMSRTFNTFTHTNKFMIKQSTYDLK